MFFSRACATLAGAASFVAAAPAARFDTTPTEVEKRDIVVPIVQQIQETNIVVVQQNLDVIEELARVAEQQFAARLQAEFALVSQLETIKNNIRVNHFRSMFSTVNTVVVTVTNVVDVRDPNNINNRYFVNQLLADNGVPDSQVVVMVTASETMTIGAQETNSAEIDQVIEQIAGGQVGLPTLRNYDAAFPFGQINEAVLLPFGTEAPSNALVFNDPANIIFAGQTGLFVENFGTFAQDCSLFATLGNSFFSPVISVFPSFQQLAAEQALNLIIGSGIPPALLIQTETQTATVSEETTTATEETATETEEMTTTMEEMTATEEATATETEAEATQTEEGEAMETGMGGEGKKEKKDKREE